MRNASRLDRFLLAASAQTRLVDAPKISVCVVSDDQRTRTEVPRHRLHPEPELLEAYRAVVAAEVYCLNLLEERHSSSSHFPFLRSHQLCNAVGAAYSPKVDGRTKCSSGLQILHRFAPNSRAPVATLSIQK